MSYSDWAKKMSEGGSKMGSKTTDIKTSFWKCPYSGRCSSEGLKCYNCSENPDVKEDHYKPKKQPYIWPRYPYYYSPRPNTTEPTYWCCI
jgi:hypothetical protein